MGRGVRQSAIFKTEDDYYVFLVMVEQLSKKLDFEIYSVCLMTNHFHLMLKTNEIEIWKFMNRLMSGYAKFFNSKYGYKGHLFDSRYGAGLIEDDAYFAECSRYIHLNPVKAAMVSKPENYEYSNYTLYSGIRSSDGHKSRFLEKFISITNTERLLHCFSAPSEKKYREFVESKSNDSQMKAQLAIGHEIGEDSNWVPW